MSYVRDLAVHGLVTANLNGHVSTVLTHVRGQMLAHLGDGELLDPRAGCKPSSEDVSKDVICLGG